MIKDVIVIDLDGTLANVDHRRHFVQGKHRNYEAFHAALVDDPVNEWCKTIISQFSLCGYLIRLVSARPKSTETATRLWLNKNKIYFDTLDILRPDGDSTPDQELKRAWLKHTGKEDILFVIDDRQKVVNMWREEGLVCLQCDAWDEKKEVVK